MSTTQAWVAIGVAIASHAFTVVWWIVRRPIGRIDRLEAAVFGESGVNMRLQKFATAEDLTRQAKDLTAHMRGISEEGQRREDRLLAAIENQTKLVAHGLGELRADVRQQSNRVDELMNARGSR